MASKLSVFLSAAAACADEMHASASEIEEELESKELPRPQRREVADVCASFVSTKEDVVDELETLREKTLREREVPARSPKARSRVERIVSWLGREIPRLDAAVESLEPVPGDEPDQRYAYVLVSESAGTFHRFFARVCAAANDYRRACKSSARPISAAGASS